MKKNKKIIGLSGVAGVGKDLFYSLLSEKLPCLRFSLADNLKTEVQRWCFEHYGIDPTNCSREEKELIRPFLVFHGTHKRQMSTGRHWIEKLQQYIGSISTDKYLVITDIRYDDYKKDEVFWLKNELKGNLIHISQYKEVPDYGEGALLREYREPVNSEEERNDPKLKEAADLIVEWPRVKGSQEKVEEELFPFIEKTINWITRHGETKATNGSRIDSRC